MSGADVLTDRRVEVLQLLYEGHYQASIADELDLTRQTVGYHVGKLEEAGLVAENPPETAFQRRTLGAGSSHKVYAPTEAGMEALRAAQADGEPDPGAARQTSLTPPSPGGEPPVRDAPARQPRESREPRDSRRSEGPRVEVHNFEVKVPVEEMGIDWLPSAAQMRNWTRRWDPDFHGVYLEVTTDHILLRAQAEGRDRETAEGRCMRRVLRVMELLEEHYQCRLGRPSFRRTYSEGRTKVGVVDHPLVDEGYEEGEEATVDSTPEPGTLHPEDPADADRVVEIGRNAERAVAILEKLADQQSNFLAGLNRLLRDAADEEGKGAGGHGDPDEGKEIV